MVNKQHSMLQSSQNIIAPVVTPAARDLEDELIHLRQTTESLRATEASLSTELAELKEKLKSETMEMSALVEQNKSLTSLQSQLKAELQEQECSRREVCFCHSS